MDRAAAARRIEVPRSVREVVEEIAFQARTDRRIDKRSGVSQRLPISVIENVVSNAERRALTHRRDAAGARASPTSTRRCRPSPASSSSSTRASSRAPTPIARELIRAAVANVFDGYARRLDTAPGRGLVRRRRHRCQMEDTHGRGGPARARARRSRACSNWRTRAGIADERARAAARVGRRVRARRALAATKKIGRTDERGYQAAEPPAPRRPARRDEPSIDDMPPMPGGKKKYYN